MAKHKAPGKSFRAGISLIELAEMFPDEAAARSWFESRRWSNGKRPCPYCAGEDTRAVPKERPMPYRCHACFKFFSVRTGTTLERSKVPLKKWAWAIYLSVTNLKGVSSMKLHRDLGVTQKTAWFMAMRIREAFEDEGGPLFTGPVEADETYMGGKEKNKHGSKRLHNKGGTEGKVAVIGVKDRASNTVVAEVVESADGPTLKGFVLDQPAPDAELYTDDARAYQGLPNHKSVNHSVGQYVDGMAHTNGIESFWATLKRGYHGTYHKMSAKHLGRYVNEFAGRHNIRSEDTAD